ncbi:MAG: hypothetical protein P8174_05040 [Gemmatimonadota bacterium]
MSWTLRPILVIASGLVLALPVPLSAQRRPLSGRVVLSPTFETGRGRLHWSIGPGAGVVRSVLHFDGLSHREVRLAGRAVVMQTSHGAWLLAGSVAAGSLAGGRMLDTDFEQGVESRQSVAAVTGRRSQSWTGALGWCRPVSCSAGEDALTLWAGWAARKEDIRIQNGTQLLPDSTGMAGLDSRYEAVWAGPWIAGEATVGLPRSTLLARLTLHPLTRFRSRGRWNLRYDLAQPLSFAQWDAGWGWALDARYGYRMSERLRFTIGVRRSVMVAKDGRDIAYAANGDAYGSQLIEARWDDTTLSFGVGVSF